MIKCLEEQLIVNFYKDRVAARSQIPLINHIIEGDCVLKELNCSIDTRKAFYIHPLIQNDIDLHNNKNLLYPISSIVLAYTFEYRNIANQYLSLRQITTLDDIQLSPLQEVNQMLIADKIQNYKDFILYHKNTHPRSNELNQYFINWLIKLDVYDKFDYWFNKLQKI